MSLKLVKVLCICSLLSLTAGCWDQNFLKKQSIAFGVGYDIAEKPKEGIHSISIIRTMKPVGGGGQTEPFNNAYQVTGETPLQIRDEMNRITPGTYSTNKLRVLAIGEELAKKDLYPLLDIYFREARSNINTKIIVTEGKAVDFLDGEYIQGNLITEVLNDLIISGEKESHIPKLTIGTLMPIMFCPGQDMILPYLSIDKGKDKNLKLKGVVLFNKRKYTGKYLTNAPASLLLLMKNKGGKTAQFTINDSKSAKAINKKITIAVRRSKAKTTLKWESGKPIYHVDLTLKVSVSEYTKGLLTDKERKKLTKLISKSMTKKAEEITKTLQEANCDALGLGHKMMIQDPEKFKGYNWDEDFKDITIIPKVKIDIVSKGVLY